nr:GTP cyclohydrolase FolE2 [uncultured Halomonas sp.]
MINRGLVDVAGEAPHLGGMLSWVGMERIALPFLVAGHPVNGCVSAGVSLEDSNARGIHMSRLYLALARLEGQELSLSAVSAVLEHFLDTHQELSSSAFLDLSGEVLLKRPALISPLAGWKAYPFVLRSRLGSHGVLRADFELSIGYSSTCPCSAALSRQLIQQKFEEDFVDMPMTRETVGAWLGSEKGIVATPHSQRSQAHLTIHLANEVEVLPVETLIERSESVLGTALQTAVKRVDEQAFALANGQNLMFCEDAARRLHQMLREQPAARGFQLRVVHAESLHAHDAVARSEWNWQESDPRR